MKRQPLLLGLIFVSVGLLAACSADSPTAPPATPTPTAYTLVLTATPGQALVGGSILFQATVSTGSGVVGDGTSVTFTVSGCVPSGPSDPAFENGTCEIVRTTTAGRATATLTSNTAGTFQVVARVPQREAATTVTFSHPTSPRDLAIYSITPSRGRPEGGEQVTIRGRGFATPVAVVFRIGTADYEARVLSVSSDGSQIQAVTPALPQNTTDERVADLVVTAAAGTTSEVSATMVGAFVFDRPFAAPAIFAITPSAAVVPGPVAVSIYGSGFVLPVRVEMIAGGATENQQVVAVNPAGTQIDILAGPTAQGPGTRDVRVITRAGTSQEQSVLRTGGFTWAPASTRPGEPVVVLVQPNRGSARGGETVTIYGQNFCAEVVTSTGACSGVPEVFFDIGAPVNALRAATVLTRASDGRSMTVRTPEASPQPLPQDALVSIVVRNQSGSYTATNVFTYLAESGEPVLFSVVPPRGSPRGGEQVVLTGRNFTPPVLVEFLFSLEGQAKVLPAEAVSVNQPGTQITLRTPQASPTPVTTDVPVSIRITNQLGSANSRTATFTNVFTYIGESRPPLVYYLRPDRGSARGGEQVVVHGRFFLPPVHVLFEPGGAAEVIDVSPDGERVTIVTPAVSVQPLAQDTPANITLTSQYGTGREARVTLANGFLYLAEQPTPEIYALTPNSGPIDGGTRVSITGRGFQYPVEVTFEYPRGEFRQAQVVSVNFTTVVCISPSVAPSQPTTPAIANVRVTNVTTGKQSNTLPFRYGEAMFISAISPAQGSDRGGDRVTIYGQGFSAPVAVTLANVPAEPLTVGGTLIVARTGRVPNRACAALSGPSRVVNINSNLTATGPTFTYNPVRPFITSVSATGPGASGNTLPAPGTPCGLGTYQGTINGFDFEQLPGGGSAMRGRLETVPPVEFDTSWVSENQLKFTFPDLSGFAFSEVPCVDGSGNAGRRYVPTAVNLTLTNLANSCSDTLRSAFIFNPCDTSCRIVTPLTLSLAPSPLNLLAGTQGNMTVTLSVAQAAPTTVTLVSSAPSVASVPPSVTIPAGLTSATFPVSGVSPGSGVSITASVALPGVTPANANVTVSPMTLSLQPNPLTITGTVGSTGNLTVVLGAAVASPVPVSLSSSNPALVSVPSSVTVQANTNSATFPVTKVGAGPGTATVTATLPSLLGGSSTTATVNVP